MISGDPRLPQLSGEESQEKFVAVPFYRRFQERFYTLWRELARDNSELWARIDAAGSGTVQSVDVSGGTTGLTVSGGPVTTSGTLTLAGTLDADNGGTGQSSYAVGDLLYASGTTTLSKLADVATGSALISGGVGVAPSWGKVGLTTHVSGTLATGNGGTGLTSFTANGVVYASSTSALTTGSGLLFDGTNLGIGTSPSYQLHVQSTGLTWTGLFQNTTNNSSANGLYVRTEGSNSANRILVANSGAGGGNSDKFYVAGDGTTYVAGHLGVGSAPSYKLHVSGQTYSTGGFLATATDKKPIDLKLTVSGGGAFPQGQAGVTDTLMANQVLVDETNVDATTNILYGFRIKHDIRGSGTVATTGARNAFESVITLNNTTADRNPETKMYVAVAGKATADANDTGSAGSGTWRGAVYGGNFYAQLTANATRFNNVTGAEINTNCATGSSLNYKSGVQIVQVGDDKVAGTNYDAAISISSISGAVGWKNGILFSAANGADPMQSTAKLLATADTATVDYGIYFEDYSFNEWAALFRNRSTTTGDNGLYVRTDSTNASTRILTANANGTDAFYVAGDKTAHFGGGVCIGNTSAPPDGGVLLKINGRLETDGGTVYSYSIRDSTTASAANVYIDATNGFIQRSTSSLRYKRDVRDATNGLAKVMALRPVLYKGNGDLDTDRDWGGLIAEEVHNAGLTEFVMYRDGEPDGLAYGNMVALLVNAIKEQQAQIESLQQQVAALQP